MADNSLPLVITLWETYGSNMEAVAAKLAEELGLSVQQQAYSSDAIEAATAEREREGALGRMLRNFAPVNFTAEGKVSSSWSTMETNYAKMAEENTPVVQELAAKGGIIQGRNGQFILRERPRTLHVKLDGPATARIRNAAERSGIDIERAARRQRIEDEFRSQLSQKTYGFDPRDNDYYDLVINGAELPVETVVTMIKAAAQAKLA